MATKLVINKKKKKFLEEYKHHWTITETCKALNFPRSTVNDWFLKDLKFKKQVKELERELLDYTKSKLLVAIREGNLTAIIFFLKMRHPEFRSIDSRKQVNVFSQQSVVQNQIKFSPERAKEIVKILEGEVSKKEEK
jgi:hypothetical protein